MKTENRMLKKGKTRKPQRTPKPKNRTFLVQKPKTQMPLLLKNILNGKKLD